MTPPRSRAAIVADIVRVSSGNFIEMYDFMVYAYFARYIGDAFFPSTNAFASLMLSLMTFGAGYLMRPIGAVILGAYIEKHGRRKGLLLTLSLMALGTLTVGATPAYAQIGLLAPVIVVIGRLLQGLSAGVELGGVSVYLSEIATPGNRGFYVAWQSASQQLAVLFAGVLGIAVTATLPPAQMAAWGWRAPLLVGCAIVPLLLWFRRALHETRAFETRARKHSLSSALAETAQHGGGVLLGAALVALTTTAFYFITAYTPTFGREVLHLSVQQSMTVTTLVGLSNFVWLPIGGALSDRIGQSPILVAMPLLVLASAGPLMLWLVAGPTFGRLIVVELAFSVIYALYNGAMVPRLVEMMPAGARTPGFSLAYSLAAALFGGFTPAISTYLIKATDNRAAPALWLMAAAAVSLAGVAGVWLSARRGLRLAVTA